MCQKYIKLSSCVEEQVGFHQRGRQRRAGEWLPANVRPDADFPSDYRNRLRRDDLRGWERGSRQHGDDGHGTLTFVGAMIRQLTEELILNIHV